MRAINALEKELKENGTLYCIGDVVHNSLEVQRLEKSGLKTISSQTFQTLHDCKVMIRAHGEPPVTYQRAKQNNITLIDATCPMVLKLQRDVSAGYAQMNKCNGQIVIFGKKGHAEVVGLVGQTDNTAIVISNKEDINLIDMERPLHIFSQTTKNKDEYLDIIKLIKSLHKTGEIFVTDSVCKKVSARAEQLVNFAKTKDCVLFVSGKHSSNGLYLYNLCKNTNNNTFFISDVNDIDLQALSRFNIIGISGATSTPMWLMKKIENYVHQKFNIN